jgi:hypothetical protein
MGKLLLYLCISLTPAAFGAQIIAVLDYSATLSGNNLAFSALSDGSRSASMGTTVGNPSGSANAFANAASLNMVANVVINITAGPGQSATDAFAEALSGSVRASNTTNSPQTVLVNQVLFYSLIVMGPDTAALAVRTTIQRFNEANNQWVNVDANGFALGVGQAIACNPPACDATASFTVAANSTADFRLTSRMDGSLSQAADTSGVPEPASMSLVGLAMAAIAAAARRRRW